MRALGRVEDGPRDYARVIDAAMNPYPVQVIWGALDPALPLRRYGTKALAATGLPYLAASARPSSKKIKRRLSLA
jgi:hypothetical protein